MDKTGEGRSSFLHRKEHQTCASHVVEAVGCKLCGPICGGHSTCSDTCCAVSVTRPAGQAA
eukprot:9131205-Pyramimonas_sp.AAC.1